MKIAILGINPIALEMASTVFEIGGHPILFGERCTEHILDLYPEEFSVSEASQSILGLKKPIETKQEYLDLVIAPLFRHFYSLNMIKQVKLLRVQKRFIGLTEDIGGSSRINDLFRVVFQKDSSTDTEESIKNNPEVFKDLGEKIIESLKDGVESFEDFDVVIDARSRVSSPNMMGPGSSLALNEFKYKNLPNIFYGVDCLNQNVEQLKKIAIVGSGNLSSLVLKNFENWLKKESTELLLITTESSPFGEFKKEKPEFYEKEISPIIDWISNEFQEQCEKFEKDIENWRQLPEFERAKNQRPEEPSPKHKVYPGFNITSLDQLIDREGLFVTVESSILRGHPDEYLETLQVDAIFVATGFGNQKEENIILNSFDKEPGYFYLDDLREYSHGLRAGLLNVDATMKNVLSFFSQEED